MSPTPRCGAQLWGGPGHCSGGSVRWVGASGPRDKSAQGFCAQRATISERKSVPRLSERGVCDRGAGAAKSARCGVAAQGSLPAASPALAQGSSRRRETRCARRRRHRRKAQSRPRWPQRARCDEPLSTRGRRASNAGARRPSRHSSERQSKAREAPEQSLGRLRRNRQVWRRGGRAGKRPSSRMLERCTFNVRFTLRMMRADNADGMKFS